MRALTTASTCRPGDGDGKWALTGLDLDEDELTVVVAFEDGVVVVTVF